MRKSPRSILLLIALVFSALFVRPPQAQAQVIGDARDLVVAGINAGQFKCSTYISLMGLLNIAATSDDGRRLQALTLARDCACAVSREINQTTHEPFQTLGAGIYDLAGYWHTVPAQVYGRVLCDLLTVLVILFT